MPTKTKRRVKIVIDRKRWSRGQNTGNTSLYNGKHSAQEERKFQCCLGFAINQGCNIHNVALAEISTPQDLKPSSQKKVAKSPLAFLLDDHNEGKKGTTPEFLDSSITENLISINDAQNISNKVREKKIAKIFDTQGVDVVFIN